MPTDAKPQIAVRRRMPATAYRRSLSSLCREYTMEAVQVLVDIMGDSDAPPSSRIKAATEILDRGYGKPAQMVNVSGDLTQRPAVDLTDDQLKAIIADGLAQAEAQGDPLDEDEDVDYEIVPEGGSWAH